jgi:hypothetical protein
MFCWRTLPLFSLFLLPIIGCSTTSDFAEDLHGDWYAEGSCDVVKISTEETTGKVWYLRNAKDGEGPRVDMSSLGYKSAKQLKDLKNALRTEQREEASDLRSKMGEEGKSYDERSAATDKLDVKHEKAMEKIESAIEKAETKESEAKAKQAAAKSSKSSGKAAKKGGPPSSDAKKETTKKLSKEEKLQVQIDENRARIATLKAEEPRWSHQDFSLKLDAAQKEIKTEGDKRIVQLDGIFVNGEGCKGTATLSGENLVFAFEKNRELDSTGKPPQSLCTRSFTLVSKKPETCTLPIEKAKAEIKKVKSLLSKNKTALRKLRNTPGSKARADSYPHACNDLDPKLHAKIGGTKGLCAPKSILGLTRAGWMVEDFKGAPSRFYDSNEMSHLLGPKKEIGEKTKLSSDKRKKNASRIKRTVYYDKSGPKSCKAKYSEKSGSLTVDCEMPMRDVYLSGSAGFKRTQKCETTELPNIICNDGNRCSDHDDCNGWICGCSTSRCTVLGFCTACPTEYSKSCEDAKFTVTGVKDWKMTKKISSRQKAAAKALAKSTYSADPIFLFRMEKAYRKVYQEEKYGKMQVEKDSGYIVKSKPLFMAYQTPHGTLVMHTEAFTGYHRADGKTYKVSCNEKGYCETELRKKK